MTTQRESAIRKAYEISYALFRVAGAGTKKPYAEQLESLALSILGNAASLKLEELAASLTAASYVLRLGGDTGLISNQHKDILLKEIATLDRMVAESGREEALPDIDIAGLFSQDEYGKNKPGKSAKRNNPAKHIFGNPITNTDNSAKEIVEEDKSGNVKERQNKIAAFIRQSGNCRLKDIHDALPDSSERTMRYDLQALMEEGVVERIGGGGPSTYYRLHQTPSVQGGAPAA